MSTIKQQRPNIIQGGMGIGVSTWRLARAVARQGEIGVVSGTCIDTVMVRELQDGDPHGRINAMYAYHDEDLVEEVIDRFYIAGGKPEDQPYDLLPIHQFKPTVRSQRMLSLAAFSEVKMARSGHDGIVGINVMAKLKRYTLPVLYGAMLAGVSAIFIGAGIPLQEARQVPLLAEGKKAQLGLDVNTDRVEEPQKAYNYTMKPSDLHPAPPRLDPPSFYPIVSTDTLARLMERNLNDELVDGWVVETPEAGGHNAPPRGKQYDEAGNPVYNERDRADLDAMNELEEPFYLAGGYGRPERLREALENGASGIQVGSLFSLTRESGYDSEDCRRIVRALHRDRATVRVDGRISPTGFPFRIIELDGEPSAREKANRRKRICDLGYLREPVVNQNGAIRGRCPAEPVENYVRKGGEKENTHNRACLCNALFADIDLPQVRAHGKEPQIFTGGKKLEDLPLASAEDPSYTARDVIHYLYDQNSSDHKPGPKENR